MVVPLVYTTCDQAYFDAHGEAFRKSAEVHGMEVRIDLLNENDPDFSLFPEPRTFYCYSRWLRLPQLLREHPAVLVTDIDSIFNLKAELPDDADMALFFRPWVSHLALKVLCAVSYWTDRAIPFAEFVADHIRHRDFVYWGNDQALVWQRYIKTYGQYKIHQLDDSFLNYNFDKQAVIWTAKGPTRKTNSVYLAAKARYAA